MARSIYLGLMSGTSFDGVDGVAVQFVPGQPLQLLAASALSFEPALREALFALQTPGHNEIEREAQLANQLAHDYALTTHELLKQAALKPSQVQAIGVHGQTIRHQPALGYTRQINNPARLAELTSIDVVADFRSRDIAAGGQGAPLVCAFHVVQFGAPDETRVICNIGGISNITILEAEDTTGGFDCGPGNVLLDYWASLHLGTRYDTNGCFAASGKVNENLLEALLAGHYFALPPPKSTGRELFNPAWLNIRLEKFDTLLPQDVQATLTALTAHSIAQAIARFASQCQAVYVCGGGARNPALMQALSAALATAGMADATLSTTDRLGVPAQQVEACAFAWLAMRFVARAPGNLASVTGALGPRVLGALYPR